MANWSLPTGSSEYSDFLTYMVALATDAATLFSSSPSNTPTGAVKYDRSNNKFQEWDGAAWVDLVISLEGGGTGATDASGVISELGLGALATLDEVTDAQVNNVSISKVFGKGALATLDVVGNSQITDVVLSKVTGAGSLAALSSITDANISSPVGVTKGGTGVTSVADIKSLLSLASLAYLNQSDITALTGLTGQISSFLKVITSTNSLTPTSPAGGNLGDATNDFNGIRCRALAPILGQKIQWYADSLITNGVSCNNDFANPQLSPIVHNTMSLGYPGVEWVKLYAVFATTVSSDKRLKSDIRDVQGCLNLIEKMSPKKYTKHDKEEFGLLAQDLYELVPEAVSKGDDGEEVVTPWGVQYEMLVPILIGAIKELKKEIEDLKK